MTLPPSEHRAPASAGPRQDRGSSCLLLAPDGLAKAPGARCLCGRGELGVNRPLTEPQQCGTHILHVMRRFKEKKKIPSQQLPIEKSILVKYLKIRE